MVSAIIKRNMLEKSWKNVVAASHPIKAAISITEVTLKVLDAIAIGTAINNMAAFLDIEPLMM